METNRRNLIGYTLPFAVFMAFLVLNSALASLFQTSDRLPLSQPQYWIFPLQTAVCAALLLVFWQTYPLLEFQGWSLGALAGVFVFFVWISPQALFGAPDRTRGFDPAVFRESAALYGLTVVARFARLVIVVPLVEEIFWRGFLMRYLINGKFTSVALGTFQPFSFFAVAVLFMLVHSSADWIPSLITGLLFNGVAAFTKNLWACVVAHAVANLGLGIYIMATRQWGFW
ncbi:MAG: CAAX prenyl protease-related protein [Terrimicrobiaceae bacterium]